MLQHREQLVVHRDPVPDEVVAGTDQHSQRDRVVTVGLYDGPAAGVGAQRVGQDERVEPVVLVARRPVAGTQ